MVMRIKLEDFIELERKLKRAKLQYYMFCIVKDTGVIILYPSFTSNQAMGFSSRLYTDLTTDIDKVYNVVIEYYDESKGRYWHMIVPTNVPDEFKQAVRNDYEVHSSAMDVNPTGENP